MDIELKIILVYMIIVIIGMFILYKYIILPTNDFFRKCDDLEHDVKTDDNLEKQHQELLLLKKQSWHKRTGNRLTTIAKMIEIKYGVEIIKK